MVIENHQLKRLRETTIRRTPQHSLRRNQINKAWMLSQASHG